MKKGKILCFCLILLLLGGCTQDKVSSGSAEKTEDGFQTYFMYDILIDAGEGFYYTDSHGFLYYFDYQSEKNSIVCNKSNCKHEDWSEDTPVEERCLAYVGGMSTGFVSGKKLYIMEKGFGDGRTSFGRIRIVESDLDRTNQREVQTMDCDSIYSYAVRDGILYASVDRNLIRKQDDGSAEVSEMRICSLCSIDLSDGTVETLIEKENNNSVIRIMGAEEDSLYLNYCYFENPFDGTNFQEAKQHNEYYQYSVETGSLQEILKDMQESQILTASLVNGKLFACTAPNNLTMTEGETIVYELKRISPDTGEEAVLARTTDNIRLFRSCAIYKKDGEKGGFVYDFRQDREMPAPKMKLDDFSTYAMAGDYFYGVLYDEQTQEYPSCFILLDDLMEGKDKFVMVHY